MLPEELTNIPPASFGRPRGSEVRTGDLGVGARVSTGVGGVTVVSGVLNPALGGVCGRSLIFRLGRAGLETFGRFEGSVFASTRAREEA